MTSSTQPSPTAEKLDTRGQSGSLGAPWRLGSWELVRLAAEGGQAQIFQARPVDSPADHVPAYAVKLLRPAWQDDSRAICLLQQEAIVGRQVSHPHLVPILASSTRHPPYYLVMPWLEGATLAQRMAAGERFDLPVVLWMIRQVAEAIDALGAAGWMHGDIKPGNLLVSAENHVTVMDLGFARRQGEEGSVFDRCVLGTCCYMAPEMLTSTLRPDVRSDIFSLGVVLYEILAGRLPFPAQTLSELISLHRQTHPVALRKLDPHLPAGVARLTREMLSKEPLRRQTPRELIDRLAALEISTFADRRGTD